MTRFYDGDLIAEISMQERNEFMDSLGMDFSMDFFNVGLLDYDDQHDAYIVQSCDYLVDVVTDWRNGVGDYADDEYVERNADILTWEAERDDD